jgi:hypothetical protein
MLTVLAWHRQGRAFAPYLGQILGLSLSKSPGIYTWSCLRCFFTCLYYTIPVDEMSIGETLIWGVQKPDFWTGKRMMSNGLPKTPASGRAKALD